MSGIFVRFVTLLITVCLTTACTTSKQYGSISDLNLKGTEPRILLMPLDLELLLIDSSGNKTLEAEWTAEAKGALRNALAQKIKEKNASPIIFNVNHDTAERWSDYTDFAALHRTIGFTINQHKLVSNLPTKTGKLGWTFGSPLLDLTRSYDADYALLIFLRDSQSSSRSSGNLTQFILAPLVPIKTVGGQGGFLSLVDLENGNIIWFSRVSDLTGSLRSEKVIRSTAENLLQGLSF